MMQLILTAAPVVLQLAGGATVEFPAAPGVEISAPHVELALPAAPAIELGGGAAIGNAGADHGRAIARHRPRPGIRACDENAWRYIAQAVIVLPPGATHLEQNFTGVMHALKNSVADVVLACQDISGP